MLDIQNIVISRIKAKYTSALKTKYPNSNFTTSDRVAKDPKFPTIYVHETASSETAEDLDGTSINAVISTIQIEVTDNTSMSVCSDVMANIVGTMKSMRYSVMSMPEFRNNNEVYRKVARFRRVIGSGDIL